MGYKANVKQHRQRRHLVVPNHLFEKPEVSGVENNIIVTEEENVPAEEMGDMKTMEKVEFENKVECEVCGKKYKNRNTLAAHRYREHNTERSRLSLADNNESYLDILSSVDFPLSK